MKGVVIPHAAPTRRKPRTQRKTEGFGSPACVAGSPGSMMLYGKSLDDDTKPSTPERNSERQWYKRTFERSSCRMQWSGTSAIWGTALTRAPPRVAGIRRHCTQKNLPRPRPRPARTPFSRPHAPTQTRQWQQKSGRCSPSSCPRRRPP